MRVTRFDFPDFDQEQIGLVRLMEGFPIWAANALLNFSMDAFRRQGWIDGHFERWPKRKDGDNSRAILTQTARLRRSLRTNYGRDWFEITSNAPYAKAHNEGDTIKQRVTAKQRGFFFAMARKQTDNDLKDMYTAMALSNTLTIKIPKRQFMGHSQLFARRIEMQMERGMRNALNK